MLPAGRVYNEDERDADAEASLLKGSSSGEPFFFPQQFAPSGAGVRLRYPHATYPPLPQGGGVDRAVSLFLRGEIAAVPFFEP